MAKDTVRLHFLGGAPRVCKSTLAKQFSDQHNVAVIHCDEVRADLWKRYGNRRDEFPELFQMVVDNEYIRDNEARWFELAKQPGYIQERQRRMLSEVWRLGILPEIERYALSGTSVIFEGAPLYPQLVAELPYLVHYVCVGTQQDQARHMIRHARENPETDWMGKWSDKRITFYAALQEVMSRDLHIEALRHGLRYVEMSGNNYLAKRQAVLDLLVSDASLTATLVAH